ncbi:hypothetical protein ACJJTC_013511 [Scirpophaga incertulas]
MEGTVDGMKLAIPAPSCRADGSFEPRQCSAGRCWCVDSFGLPRKQGQCPYLVPSSGTCEWSCRSDAECGADERCCATGCGTACARTDPRSACQHRRALALHTAAESGSPPAWSWVPTCADDGAFEPVQCKDKGRTCWCVDTAGNEIPGTRATNSTPNCEAPNKCPPAECSEEGGQAEAAAACEHGRALDAAGCPRCACRDPCAEARCPPGDACALVPLECDLSGQVGSCGVLAVCTGGSSASAAAAGPCPGGGAPLPAPGAAAPLTCGPNAASCPSTHACRYGPHSAPAVCCPKPRTVCFESKDEGVCSNGSKMNVTRWHFNHERNRCERFQYHGCSGNHNNFHTKEECNAVCPVPELRVERLREKNTVVAAQKYGNRNHLRTSLMQRSWVAWEPSSMFMFRLHR